MNILHSLNDSNTESNFNKILTSDALIKFLTTHKLDNDNESNDNGSNESNGSNDNEFNDNESNDNESNDNEMPLTNIELMLQSYKITYCPGHNLIACVLNCLIGNTFIMKSISEQNKYIKYLKKDTLLLNDLLCINIFIFDKDKDKLINPEKYIKWRKSIFLTQEKKDDQYIYTSVFFNESTYLTHTSKFIHNLKLQSTEEKLKHSIPKKIVLTLDDKKILNRRVKYADKTNFKKVDDTKIDDTKVDDTKVDDTKIDDNKIDDTKVDDTKIDDNKEIDNDNDNDNDNEIYYDNNAKVNKNKKTSPEFFSATNAFTEISEIEPVSEIEQYSEKDLEKLKMPELRTIAKSFGVTGTSKKVLVARILEKNI